jgi:hypothetical protein
MTSLRVLFGETSKLPISPPVKPHEFLRRSFSCGKRLEEETVV